jgi:AcrR family transcriptional regulator
MKDKDKELMKISELSRRSGFPSSTIRYYTNEGLLPPPIKMSKARAYYSIHHQRILQMIKVKQETEKKTLTTVKKEIEQEVAQINAEGGNFLFPSGKREGILSTATKLFLKYGYGDTSIGDIANHAKMSKETIYLNYKNKEEIFMACADRIFHEMFDDVWNEIKDEKNMSRRLFKRGCAFLASYPQWINMMNLVKNLSVGDNPVFKDRFRQLIQQMVKPLSHDIEQMKHEGYIASEIDENLAGYILLGMAEYGSLYAKKEHYPEDELVKIMISFFANIDLLSPGSGSY